MQLEHVVLETKFTADEAGAIEGIAWDFSRPDRVGDAIEPAAFSAAVGKTLPALFAHDQSQVVGVFDQITVEADGLHVKGRLLVDTVERAREVRSMIQAKAVQGLSIGFLTRKAAPRKGGGRTIQELELLETSIVAVPAHPNARITSQKDIESMTTATTEPTAPAPAATVPPAIDTKALDAITARLDAMETKLARPAIVTGKKVEENLEAKALNQWARTGQVDAELKTLVTGTPSAGGYTVAPEYRADIIKKLTELNPIRALASVTTVGTSKVYWPVLDSDAEGSWVSETADRTEDEPTFAQTPIDVFEHALIVPISRQLLEDSIVDMSGLLAERIAIGFAKAESTAFLTGSGTGEPSGILDALGSIAGKSDTSDVLADIVDAFYALPSAYAARGSWLLSRPTIAKIRKAADLSDNRNGIWSDSLQSGTPPRLLGAPVYEAPGLDTHGAVSTGNVGACAIFGDIGSAFRIVDRVGLDIMRDDFTGASKGIVKFHARKRVGSAVVLPEALVAITTT